MADNTNDAITPVGDFSQQDPIFGALRTERAAYHRFSDALSNLAQAGAFDLKVTSDALERLPDLEEEEAKASAALMEAERAVLTTMPTTIRGAAALLGFLRRHLGEDPDIPPIVEASSNIEAMFERSGSMPYDAARQRI